MIPEVDHIWPDHLGRSFLRHIKSISERPDYVQPLLTLYYLKHLGQFAHSPDVLSRGKTHPAMTRFEQMG